MRNGALAKARTVPSSLKPLPVSGSKSLRGQICGYGRWPVFLDVHQFRHLNAMLLITSRTDARTVSAALGHSQTSTTLNIYTHTFAEAQARAGEAVAAALERSITKTG